jgi:replication factor A2
VEISQICLVGQIRNISKQNTNVTYRLDDGTGIAEVKVWIDTDVPTHDEQGKPLPQAKEPLAQDDWVKVWGKLKSFNSKRHVGAFSMKRITDKNEINYHLLEATYVHLYFTKGPLDQANGQANGAQAGAGGDTTMQDAGEAGNRGLPRMGLHAQKVYNALLDTPQGHEGLHVQQIAAASGLTVPDVLKGGDELMGSAVIFTTLDDNTWALMND